jgi:hypothetical protein
MMTTAQTHTADLEARARGLAIVVGGAVVVVSALAWGVPGLVAAAAGAALSIANVFLLTRFASRAVAIAAAGGPNTAIVRLTSVLGAKTIALLAIVWVLCKTSHLRLLPFALGLLVTVICLLAAGLVTSLGEETSE